MAQAIHQHVREHRLQQYHVERCIGKGELIGCGGGATIRPVAGVADVDDLEMEVGKAGRNRALAPGDGVCLHVNALVAALWSQVTCQRYGDPANATADVEDGLAGLQAGLLDQDLGETLAVLLKAARAYVRRGHATGRRQRIAAAREQFRCVKGPESDPAQAAAKGLWYQPGQKLGHGCGYWVVSRLGDRQSVGRPQSAPLRCGPHLHKGAVLHLIDEDRGIDAVAVGVITHPADEGIEIEAANRLRHPIGVQ